MLLSTCICCCGGVQVAAYRWLARYTPGKDVGKPTDRWVELPAVTLSIAQQQASTAGISRIATPEVPRTWCCGPIRPAAWTDTFNMQVQLS